MLRPISPKPPSGTMRIEPLRYFGGATRPSSGVWLPPTSWERGAAERRPPLPPWDLREPDERRDFAGFRFSVVSAIAVFFFLTPLQTPKAPASRLFRPRPMREPHNHRSGRSARDAPWHRADRPASLSYAAVLCKRSDLGQSRPAARMPSSTFLYCSAFASTFGRRIAAHGM